MMTFPTKSHFNCTQTVKCQQHVILIDIKKTSINKSSITFLQNVSNAPPSDFFVKLKMTTLLIYGANHIFPGVNVCVTKSTILLFWDRVMRSFVCS